jgi:cupin 2 domain-containing protein
MMTSDVFADVPQTLQDEQIVELLATPHIRIERIVSTGQASPPDFWYDQNSAEWVILLAGSAGLLFEGETAPRVLAPGNYVRIDKHVRHRVAWTDPTMPTVWLAIHYQ